MLVMIPPLECPLPSFKFLRTGLTILRNKVMELELGLKITQTRDDISSTADLRIAKDGGGIVFLSRENENMFILTAHLKGYRKEHININISEDGTCITITGNKAVQEKVMLGCILYKKDVELRGFTKTFNIPNVVILDKIKAEYHEDEAVLTVVMPKMVQGVSGHIIKEVEEREDDQGHMTETDAPESAPSISDLHMAPDPKQNSRVSELEGPQMKDPPDRVEQQTNGKADNQSGSLMPEDEQAKHPEDEEHRDRDHTAPVTRKPKKIKKICAPAVAGSALLVSLIVLVIHLIRAKR